MIGPAMLNLEHLDVRARVTFRNELIRQGAAGIVETAGQTFLLLIAIKYFQSGDWFKGFLATGGSAGQLLAPSAVGVAWRMGLRPNVAAAGAWFIGGCGFLLAGAIPYQWSFLLGSLLGLISISACIPMMTQIYQENYPQERRGQLFSWGVLVRIICSIIFAFGAGFALEGNFHNYPLLMITFGLAMWVGAYCLRMTPSHRTLVKASRNPLKSMHYVKEDRLFRNVLISWMFLGFANLVMLPMRVEYVSNARYGINLNAEHVALLTSVLPGVARLLSNQIWAWCFDRFSFISNRMTINLAIMLGILSFFTGTHWLGLAIGAVIFGICNGGADLSWSLWVTKVAKPDRVGAYMAIHVFFTGLRSGAAPILAYLMVGYMPLWVMGIIMSCSVLVATLLLWFERQRMQNERKPDTNHEETGLQATQE